MRTKKIRARQTRGGACVNSEIAATIAPSSSTCTLRGNMQNIRTALFMLFLCLGVIYGQTTSGSVSGTITDPNGASVPGATIVATENASGRSFTAVTTEAGIYTLPALPVGV